MTASQAVTRGHGRLEGYLSRRRMRQADRLIDDRLRGGAILDYGCGSYPAMLLQTDFARKHGIDQLPVDTLTHVLDQHPELQLHQLDIETTGRLPFDDGSMAVVTMLAVFEHVPEPDLVVLLDEVARVLAPGGQFVMTTPAGWTAPIIWTLSRIGMISADEADEHEAAYSHRRIRQIIGRTRLGEGHYRRGCFEWGMNNWVCVTKAG